MAERQDDGDENDCHRSQIDHFKAGIHGVATIELHRVFLFESRHLEMEIVAHVPLSTCSQKCWIESGKFRRDEGRKRICHSADRKPDVRVFRRAVGSSYIGFSDRLEGRWFVKIR
jgi:hypothetical protein